MSDAEKMMFMFTAVHGKMTGSVYIEMEMDEYLEPTGINVMKDGNLCWYKSKSDILFDYITINWK